MKTKKFSFIISSFIAGFSLMTVELAASRIIAPYVGSSLYTWTSVIGIILFGLSAGYYFGGYLADKYASRGFTWIVFLLSAVGVGAVPLLLPLAKTISESSLTLPQIIVLISFLLFFLPSLFLGSLSPIILRQYTASLNYVGLSSGTLSALWSLGSIIGTFLTGFVFIGYLGSETTVFGIGLLLACMGLLFCESKPGRVMLSLLVMIVLAILVFRHSPTLFRNAIYAGESNYYAIKVADGPVGETNDARILFLDFDSHSIESKSGKALRSYPETYPLWGVLKNSIKDVFVIGGGSYSMPKYLADYYKDSKVTVAEIDPAVTEAAKRFFGLNNENISTIIGDARMILNKDNGKYDLIVEDAFNSFISLPWHLTTEEFTFEARSRLKEGGIYAANFISATKGKGSAFFKSMAKTFRKAFPNTYVLALGNFRYFPQNIILIGVNSPFHKNISQLRQDLASVKNGEWLAPHIYDNKDFSDEGGTVLTDNLAPVERLMIPTMNEYFKRYRDFYYSFLGGSEI